MTPPSEKVHQGQNVKRFREMLGMKQEALAHILGSDWNQKRVSLLEGKEVIDEDVLEQVAKALKVPMDAIKNFTPEAAYNIIGNTVTDNTNVAFFQYNPTFNPMDKLMDALDENKRLYTALLKEREDRIALLERMLTDKK